jgi:peptidase E
MDDYRKDMKQDMTTLTQSMGEHRKEMKEDMGKCLMVMKEGTVTLDQSMKRYRQEMKEAFKTLDQSIRASSKATGADISKDIVLIAGANATTLIVLAAWISEKSIAIQQNKVNRSKTTCIME